MGFEFVYAYLENLYYLAAVLTILTGATVVTLIWMRICNEIDIDDWTALMYWATPCFILFLFMTFNPDMEHIREVRTTLMTTPPVKIAEAPKKIVALDVNPVLMLINPPTSVGTNQGEK